MTATVCRRSGVRVARKPHLCAECQPPGQGEMLLPPPAILPGTAYVEVEERADERWRVCRRVCMDCWQAAALRGLSR